MMTNFVPVPNRSNDDPCRACPKSQQRRISCLIERVRSVCGGPRDPVPSLGGLTLRGQQTAETPTLPGPAGRCGPPLERGQGPPAGPLPSGRHGGPQAPRPPLGSDRSRGVSGGRGAGGEKRGGARSTFVADTKGAKVTYIYIYIWRLSMMTDIPMALHGFELQRRCRRVQDATQHVRKLVI